jgi:hypothetical protein
MGYADPPLGTTAYAGSESRDSKDSRFSASDIDRANQKCAFNSASGGGSASAVLYFFPTFAIQSAKACMNFVKNSRVGALVRSPLSSNILATPPT